MMDTDLNGVAQAHSNDMVANNYLNDVNKQGLGPQDRAKKAGINYEVKEIVATHLDLIIAHYIMCRSPSDLEVIVMSNVTKIGLGVARNNLGYMYITHLFGYSSEYTVPKKSMEGMNSSTPSP